MAWQKHFRRASAPMADAQCPLGVYIGRFQPFHLGHLHVVEQALDTVGHLVILVGSSFVPRNYFNPFSFEERRDLILASLPPVVRSRVLVLPLLDMTYNDAGWLTQVQNKAKEAFEHFKLMSASIALVGHQKDGTSFYLKMFPQWGSIDVPAVADHTNGKPLSATTIREALFNEESYEMDFVDVSPNHLPMPVIEFLADFSTRLEFQHLVEEYAYVKKYKKQFEGLSYPPIFQTVDSVVVQSGHILLIKRKSRPGKGLWALPGGFLNASERIQDACYRELREETKIRVPEPVLRGCTIAERTFDEVHRSARGRTITTAFLIRLEDGPLAKVKGADDAEKAKWVPLADLRQDQLFEDHYHIIKSMTGLI